MMASPDLLHSRGYHITEHRATAKNYITRVFSGQDTLFGTLSLTSPRSIPLMCLLQQSVQLLTQPKQAGIEFWRFHLFFVLAKADDFF